MSASSIDDPRTKGVQYELAVGAYLAQHTKSTHAVIAGVDAREYHLAQIYLPSMRKDRVVPRQQMAALHAGRRLRSKNGTSPLLHVDHLEVLLPAGVVVTRQLDSKYTDKPKLPFDNAYKTVHLAKMNGLRTTLVTNVEGYDGELQTALAENDKLTIETLPCKKLAGPPHASPAPPPGTHFEMRVYQVDVFAALGAFVDNMCNKKNSILGNFPAAFGKTHLAIWMAQKVLDSSCDLCFILVTQIDLATNLIDKAKLHLDCDVTFEDRTSVDQSDLKRQLSNPDELDRLRKSRTVPVVYYRTFYESCADLDLTTACVIGDEVHKYHTYIDTINARLWVGLTARRDEVVDAKFDKVERLNEVNEKKMLETAVAKHVVVRIDALRDTSCDTYEDIVASVDASFTVDLDEISSRVINAYNYSCFGQAVVVCNDTDVLVDQFDTLRDKMHDHMMETNPQAYACAFERLFRPPADIHAHKIHSKHLVKILQCATGVRAVLDVSDFTESDLNHASKDSVINVDDNWWVAKGFEIVRQDSKSKEGGFRKLSQMLEEDRSGLVLTKQQFFEGHDYPLLRHVILAGRLGDPHRLYQLAMRVARGTDIAMVTSVGGTQIDTILHMLEIYDPEARLFQIERFENVSLKEVALRTESEWSALSERMARTKAVLSDTRRPKKAEDQIRDTLIYLSKHHRFTQPTGRILRIPYPVTWRDKLVAAIENSDLTKKSKGDVDLLLKLEWLDFNRTDGFLAPTICRPERDEAALSYASINTARWESDSCRLKLWVQKIADHYAARGESIPRGMHAVRYGTSDTHVLVPAHLIGTLHRLARAAPDVFDASATYAVAPEQMAAPVRRIDVPTSKSAVIWYNKTDLTDQGHALYLECLARFEPILCAVELQSAVYDLNCSFQTSHDNVMTTLLAVHKWSLGYNTPLPYKSTGRDGHNTDEKPQRIMVKPTGYFGLHTDVYSVFEQLSTHKACLKDNHNSVPHKLSKIFYVQIMIFYVLLPLIKEGTHKSYEPLLKALDRIKVRAAIPLDIGTDDIGTDEDPNTNTIKRARHEYGT